MIKELSRSSASKLTLGTQVLSVCLLVGAGAVFAVGLPDRDRPSATIPASLTHGTTGQSDADTGRAQASADDEPFRVDMAGLAARLSMLDNAPVLPEIEVPEEPVVGDALAVDDVPPQPFASRVRYLGMISVGDASMAFVNIDGTQRIVRQGTVVPPMEQRPEFGELTITAISNASITVSHEDGEADIKLAEREGPAITLVAGGEVDQIDAAQSNSIGQFETNARGNPLPASEVERRRAALERQRTQNPRDYDGPGLRMPEQRIIGSMGNDRSSRDRSNRRGRDRNTGGEE